MSERRLVGPDVVRALALAGVVVMNYHGYLNGGDAATRADSSLAERWFDPFGGPLATRFAATFVLVAGVGVTLLTQRAWASGDQTLIAEHRWRLVRRGLALYGGGILIEWIWPGTILFFYGAFFVLAAALFTLRTWWVVTVGALSAVAAAGLHLWSAWRIHEGHDTSWLYPAELDSFRNLMLRTFVGYTHPVLPWLAFLCAGIVLGRTLPRFDALRWRVAAVAGGVLVGASTLNVLVDWLVEPPTPGGPAGFWRATGWETLTSIKPMDRGVLYTASALASALLAYCVISWWAEHNPASPTVDLLARAGQMSLSIYLLHVFVFNGVVDWWGWVKPTGLGTALMFALTFYVWAVLLGAWWHRFVSRRGPAEWLYRHLGG